MNAAATHAARPLIAITMGDPAGVGPELCLRALAAPEVQALCTPLVVGDAGVLTRVAGACSLPRPTQVISREQWERNAPVLEPAVLDCAAIAADAVRPGMVQAACGQAAHASIKLAAAAALAGRVAAIATAPIHKEALRLAGVAHPGHTELLAELTGAPTTCMMLAADEIVVSLVTIHVALAQAPHLLTRARIEQVAELTVAALRRLGKPDPRLAVCGLNPHAGEQGLFGREEIDVIAPAVAALQGRGYRAEGPLAPDTAFVPGRRQQVDAYIVMYHDQGLIPFKMLAFDHGVNITLGLPIVRTSVDHGTAFDIAWKGTASARSLIESIRWAVRLSAAPE